MDIKGDGYMLTDVGGQPLYHWDADGKVFRSVYDALRRPLAQWGDGKKLSKIIYGEGATNDTANNLRGQVLASYDGAGKHYVDAYDFKGQSLKSYMRLLADGTLADANWDAGGSALVTDELFFTEVVTDALGRPLSADTGRITGTSSPTTEHNITTHTYEKDGALKTVKVGSDTYVQDIRHNAKGQREAIWYGNSTKTSYTYDDKTHRLTRLLTVKLSTNDKLQDLNYFYDAVGNITTIRDDAQQTIFFSNTVVRPDTTYTYDALYRLIKAEGREQIGWASTATATPFNGKDNTADNPWANQTHKGDGAAVQSYTQRYRYDAVGNILELKHIATDGSYTRSYVYTTGSNRLAGTNVGTSAPALSDSFSYSHDARGNMTQMPHLSAMSYDLLNQMAHVTAGTTEAYYQYSGGQRVKKYLDKGSTVTEERIYFGSYEVYRKFTGSSLNVERTTLHISDDMGRIAMIEKRLQGSDGSASSLKRFIYSNHLQSASLELDETGAIISYEEYHPYGTTAYQAMNSIINAVAKRYRFTSKERDEETGLNYYGARYYALWIAKWCAVDPLESKYAGQSPYNYCLNSPIIHIDETGCEPRKSVEHLWKPQQDRLKTANPLIPKVDWNKMGIVLPGATVTAKAPSFWHKAGVFAKGFVEGLVIGAAVGALAAILIATGGTAAPLLGYTIVAYGLLKTTETVGELSTGKEWGTGRPLTQDEKLYKAGGLVGGTLGGGKGAKLGLANGGLQISRPISPEKPPVNSKDIKNETLSEGDKEIVTPPQVVRKVDLRGYDDALGMVRASDRKYQVAAEQTDIFASERITPEYVQELKAGKLINEQGNTVTMEGLQAYKTQLGNAIEKFKSRESKTQATDAHKNIEVQEARLRTINKTISLWK